MCIFQNDLKLRIAHFRLATISSNGYCVLDTEHRIKERRWAWKKEFYYEITTNRQHAGKGHCLHSKKVKVSNVQMLNWEAENKTSPHSRYPTESKCANVHTQLLDRQEWDKVNYLVEHFSGEEWYILLDTKVSLSRDKTLHGFEKKVWFL